MVKSTVNIINENTNPGQAFCPVMKTSTPRSSPQPVLLLQRPAHALLPLTGDVDDISTFWLQLQPSLAIAGT